MSHIALGLMSGTSADGCSAVLASFEGRTFKILEHSTLAYPPDIKSMVLLGPALSASQISALNIDLGEIFAKAARRVLKKSGLTPSKVACIGSHGQTIYHGPSDSTPNTLQIGDARVIAERTGLTTVSDFRTRDIAAGGCGAPLIPFFDDYFFGGGPVRAMQNIGGIANVTVVGRGLKSQLAFDNGPGNCLMDLVVRMVEKGAASHDHFGRRAKKGTILMEVLAQMMQHPYLAKSPPKSTGPELFNENFLREYFGESVESRADDVLATLNQFTCLSIQESYRKFLFKDFPIEEVIVSGGGVYNKTLMKKLTCLLAPISVKSIEALGVPAQIKEPLAFAFFGLRRLQNKSNHLASATGAKKSVILGSVTPA